MKNSLKFGIAVFAAAMVFGMASCDSPEDPIPPRPNSTPVAGDYTVGALTHTVDGSAKAVTITPKTGKSSGKVTVYYEGMDPTSYTKSETAPKDTGTYTVTFDVTAASGWNAAAGLSAGILTINAENQDPAAEDFDYSGFTQSTGSTRAVTITPKPGKSGGAITVYYEGADPTDYDKNTAIPSAAGTYTVTFDVAAASGWNAKTGLAAPDPLVIQSGNRTPAKADYDITGDFTYIYGQAHAEIAITPKADKSQGVVTIKFDGSTAVPSAVGTYTVTFDVAAYPGWDGALGLNAGTLYIIDDIDTLVEMVFIEGGTFQMGNPNTSVGEDYERPVHEVTISAFYMGKYEVTQAQYQEVMLMGNPSRFTGLGFAGETPENRPVEQVGWYYALVFCNKLSMKENLTPAYSIDGETDPAKWGTIPASTNATWNAVTCNWNANGYRLPTEAEWEYAAKGGSGSPNNYLYSGSDTAALVAWYMLTTTETHEVGKKDGNGLGLYDMSGNVFEWCWDETGAYSSDAQTDPVGASSGSDRVIRGGCWNRQAADVRSAFRGGSSPTNLSSTLGFRLVRPHF